MMCIDVDVGDFLEGVLAKQNLERDAAIVEHAEASRSIARDRKSTRLNSSHSQISYAVFCLKNPATTDIYPLSLHDALPIYPRAGPRTSRSALIRSRRTHRRHDVHRCRRRRFS